MGILVDFSKDLHDYSNEEEYEVPGLCYCYDCRCEFLSTNGFPMCPNCLSFDTYYCESDWEMAYNNLLIEEYKEEMRKITKKREEIEEGYLSIKFPDYDLFNDDFIEDDFIYDYLIDDDFLNDDSL